MTEAEIDYYILCHALDIRTPEQVASFMMDNQWCRDSDEIKKEVARHVHKDKFPEIWKEARRIMEGGAIRQ